MRRFAQIAPFIVAALVAGCGSSSSSSSSKPASTSSSVASSSSTKQATAGASSQLTLSETEFKILPASPVVAHPGTITITVKNAGKITHALAVQTPSGVARTGDIAPGQTATLRVALAKDGRYTLYCPIDGHRMHGMQGTLIVGASSGTGGAAVGSSSTTSSSSGGSGGGNAYSGY
jgi:uncharacterized cupredoxin-like copper-binding protein